jgi:arylsulfatase A-like enzyme
VKRVLLLAGAVAALALAVSSSSVGRPYAGVQDRPNVVLFVLDDATVEDVEYMPNVQRLLVDHGTTFTRTYSPFPVCCPARATILTGLYPHNHRVLDNVAPLGGFSKFRDTRTVATYLDDDYATALIGKYLNDYDDVRYVPPGWDLFTAPSDATAYNYLNQTLNINGDVVSVRDTYMTGFYGREARAFLDASAPTSFLLYLAWVAPHKGSPHEYATDPAASPYVAPKYQDTYTGPLRPEDASYNEADVSDKPAGVRQLPRLTAAQIRLQQEKLAQRREALRSVDDEVARIVQRVHRAGELQDTFFIFTSDNGQMQGQHRVPFGKSVVYEPSSRVPLVIRGPGFPAGSSYDGVTGLQDLTPTILDMTNRRVPGAARLFDGVSLSRLVNGTLETRRPQLIERAVSASLSDLEIADGREPSAAQADRLRSGDWLSRALVSADNWKYVHYVQTGEIEMYDLDSDPDELQNLAGNPRFGERQGHLGRLLAKYQSCDGLGCR